MTVVADAWLDLAGATALTLALLDHLGLDHVRVDRYHGDGWGETDARSVIRYRSPCPLLTVPHEVAHFTTGEDHTPRWAAEYERLIPLAVAIAEDMTGRRLASATDE